MPLPSTDVKGFGYVTSGWVDLGQDNDSGSEDSRLSSTSLINTLVEPSSSEEDWLWQPEETERYSVARKTLQQTMTYMQRNKVNQEQEAALNLNLQEVERLNRKKVFEEQVVPMMSEMSTKLLLRKQSDGRGSSRMPYSQSLNYEDTERRVSLNWGGRAMSGVVGELMSSYMDSKHNTNGTARMLHRYKEHLELHNERMKEKLSSVQTEDEREQLKQLQRKTIEREEEVLGRLNVEQQQTVRETLGALATSGKRVFRPPRDKLKRLLPENSEYFFKNKIRTNSWDSTAEVEDYDTYYNDKDNLNKYIFIEKSRHRHSN